MAFETDRLKMPQPAAHVAQRAALFRESPIGALERYALGLAWSLSPKRIRGLPNIVRLCFDEFLSPDHSLPDPAHAFDSPPGLAGIVHEIGRASCRERV